MFPGLVSTAVSVMSNLLAEISTVLPPILLVPESRTFWVESPSLSAMFNWPPAQMEPAPWLTSRVSLETPEPERMTMLPVLVVRTPEFSSWYQAFRFMLPVVLLACAALPMVRMPVEVAELADSVMSFTDWRPTLPRVKAPLVAVRPSVLPE